MVRKLAPEGLYGRRKMTAYLRRTAMPEASAGSVDRAMRTLGLSGVRRDKGIRTTIPAKDGTRAGDLLDRDFTAAGPGPDLGHRLHLRPNLGRVHLRRVHRRRLRPTDRGLARCDEQADRPGDDPAADGAVATRPRGPPDRAGRADSPLGCRVSRRIQPVVATPRSRRCAMATADGARRPARCPSGARRQWAADRALRPAMRSPGRPEPSRAVQRQFWRLIATGITTRGGGAGGWRVDAGRGPLVSSRWRHAADQPGRAHRPLSVLRRARGDRAAARPGPWACVRSPAQIGRDPATISRELRRNAATRGGKQEYRATVAQWKAQQAAKRPEDREAGGQPAAARVRAGAARRRASADPTARSSPGPTTPPWKGLNKPHRAGPALGDGVEPGADRAPAAGRLPR